MQQESNHDIDFHITGLSGADSYFCNTKEWSEKRTVDNMALSAPLINCLKCRWNPLQTHATKVGCFLLLPFPFPQKGRLGKWGVGKEAASMAGGSQRPLNFVFSPANEKETSILPRTNRLFKDIGDPRNGSYGPKMRGMKHRTETGIKVYLQFLLLKKKSRVFLRETNKNKAPN